MSSNLDEYLRKLPRLDINGNLFIDPETNCAQQFRGINLGGNTKLPQGWKTSSSSQETFANLHKLSFVDRPIPLSQADEHCQRLQYWGFNLIRLVVPWEALEHQGPGVYDEAMVDYLISLLSKFAEYGLRCFIDPHQDCWSRLCGGSGAPNWTLYVAGLDPEHFKATGAAITQFEHDDRENFPIMTWPTNYAKLGAATMFTLFFGGKEFAPKCLVRKTAGGEPINIQDYLQGCFIEAYKHLFTRLKGKGLLDSVVLGLDTLNEPSEGYIGTEDISKLPLLSLTSTRNGPCPNALQTMILGTGQECTVDKYDLGTLGFIKSGRIKIDPKGTLAWVNSQENRNGLVYPNDQPWQTDGQCIWAMHDIWDPSTQEAKIKGYFHVNPITEKKYEFLEDFWLPFVKRLTQEIRQVHQHCIMFVEPPVNFVPPKLNLDRMVYAPHWYDGKTLLTLHFSWWTFDFLGYLRHKYWFIGQAVKLGESNVRKCFQEMIQLIKHEGEVAFNPTPCLIGECGIPFNLDQSKAYKSGDYSDQVRALDATLQATEQAGVSCALWNYCATNEHEEGDLWNREDLSIYSSYTVPLKSDLYLISLDKGGRALEAAVRPYAKLTPGTPVLSDFTINPCRFHYEFRVTSDTNTNDSKKTKEARPVCEIVLPPHHFPPHQPLDVKLTSGSWTLQTTPLTKECDGPMLQSLMWELSSSTTFSDSFNQCIIIRLADKLDMRSADCSTAKSEIKEEEAEPYWYERICPPGDWF